MIHALKILPEFFKAMAAGTKSFEVRKNDRPYHTGDYVALNEWNSEQYTGKCTLQKIVYILNDPEYCKEGYVILGLEPCAIGEIRGRLCDFGFRALRNRRNKRKPPYVARQIGGGSGI